MADGQRAFTRRYVLRRSLGGVLGLAMAGALLEACSSPAPPSATPAPPPPTAAPKAAAPTTAPAQAGQSAPPAAAKATGGAVGQFPQGVNAGGTLVVAIGSDPSTLNAGWSTATETQMVTQSMFESLLIDTSDSGTVPNLAESWQVAGGGESYTFKLRQGVKWHDGQPFTAADVKFTVEEVWKKLHSRNRQALQTLASVETPDDYTVVLRFAPPYGGLMASLGKYDGNIIPKHIYGDGQDLATHPRNLDRPIGTGPFKWAEHAKGDRITVEKNTDYWRQGQPFLDKIVFRVISDANARALAIQAGDVDYLPTAAIPTLAQVQQLRGRPGIVVQDYQSSKISQAQALMFNLTRPQVGKQEVRQAIAHLIDKQVLVDRIMLGYANTMEGPLRDPWFTEGAPVRYALDRAAAEQLLDRAGFPRGADGNRFNLVVTYESSRYSTPLTAQVVQEQLRAVGIGVELKGEEASAAQSRMYRTYDYDIGLPGEFVGTGPDPAAGLRALYHSSAIGAGVYNNGAQYNNPQVDKLLNDAQAESDTAKRKVLLDEMVKIVTTELPYLWLMSPKRIVINRDAFANFGWTDPYEVDYATLYQVKS